MTTPPGIDLSATLSSLTPAHGDTLVLTYVVGNNNGTPAHQSTISGGGVIGGQNYTATVTFTFPAIPPLTEEFSAPTSADLPTFTQDSADPHKWTVTVP